MKREIKFRHPLTDRQGKFIEWFYWGFIDNEFITPANQLNGRDERKKSEQYTGLKDKNGKDIYEGDIMGPAVVKFRNGRFNLYYDYGKAEEMEDTFETYARNWSVIGNIHENPELL